MAAAATTTTKKLQVASSSPNTHKSYWSTKQYILVAVVGTLAATVIVIGISELLSPGEIDFSVTKASRMILPLDGGVELNLTVAAANPGWRAAVEYRGFDVKLQYTPFDGKPTLLNEDDASSVRTPFVQPPRNTTAIPVRVFVSGDYWVQNMMRGKTDDIPITAQVTATVRFLIGKACTRSYHIAVSCYLGLDLFKRPTVSFNHNNTADCVAAGPETV